MMPATPHVLFLLPAFAGVPVGGFKMVYQYANGLAAEGYSVTITYACRPSESSFSARCYSLLRTGFHWLRGWTRHCPWFPIDIHVSQRLTWTVPKRRLRHADIAIAVDCRLAAALDAFPAPALRQKFYLIQGLETFVLPSQDLFAIYRLPIRKIAISSWLCRIIETMGQSANLLPNGYDETFRQTCAVSERFDASVCAMFGETAVKDWPTALDTLLLVRQAHSDLQATVFGTGPRPADLPGWATYVRKPTSAQLNSIYNEAAIFIGTSIQEGWGLPVGEAMRCGTAVVCTDNGGYAEMAIPNKTALVVPAGDAPAMAAAVNYLIDNPSERIRLANAGHTHIQDFTIEKSVRRLEAILDEALPPSLRPTHE